MRVLQKQKEEPSPKALEAKKEAWVRQGVEEAGDVQE